MGNLHLRFDEGRAGRAIRVAFSPTLPPERSKNHQKGDLLPAHPPAGFQAHPSMRICSGIIFFRPEPSEGTEGARLAPSEYENSRKHLIASNF